MTKISDTKKILVLFTITVLLTTTLALQYAPTAFAQRICGDKICTSNNGPDAEKEREQMRQQVKSGTAPEEEPVEEEMPVPDTTTPEMEVMPEEKMKEKMERKAPTWKTATGTIKSIQDPGVGHETHQLAIILPPSDKTYSGLLTYSASEPIQLVALHGPLAEGEDGGQAIWTPDGKTKFALTFVDNKAAAGTWMFTGNALAVHTLNTDQFTVSYSVVAGQ